MRWTVTRNLVSMGKLPVTVGLFFSLGHSTIVFAFTVAWESLFYLFILLSTSWCKFVRGEIRIIVAVEAIDKLPNISEIGGLIGEGGLPFSRTISKVLIVRLLRRCIGFCFIPIHTRWAWSAPYQERRRWLDGFVWQR